MIVLFTQHSVEIFWQGSPLATFLLDSWVLTFFEPVLFYLDCFWTIDSVPNPLLASESCFLVLYYLRGYSRKESTVIIWINSLKIQFCHSSNSFIHPLKQGFFFKVVPFLACFLSVCSFLRMRSFTPMVSQLPLHGSDSQNYTFSSGLSPEVQTSILHILILDNHRFLKFTMSQTDLLTSSHPQVHPSFLWIMPSI